MDKNISIHAPHAGSDCNNAYIKNMLFDFFYKKSNIDLKKHQIIFLELIISRIFSFLWVRIT